ncbi:MAG: pantetheine-phosphate adenylyltransferase [Candidatus Palauibacterales bacterium]|nr:pantetheine-phosphate adenylyltransferase [Candidatus Palauibacterales bacterium]
MTKPRVAIYPGSFDPLTLGHEDIARRCLHFLDRLIIAVAHHPTQEKDRLFSVDERVEMIEERFRDESRIEVTEFSGLLVDFAKSRDASLVIRGLRAVSDFEYEFQMALMNRELWPEFEVVFMTPAADYTFLSASLVREISGLGGDVSRFVSASVLKRLQARSRS